MKTRTILASLLATFVGIMLVMGKSVTGLLFLLIGIISGISVMQEKKQSKE
jgi:uncharacterized membrane protein